MKNITIQVAHEANFVSKLRQSVAGWLSRENNLFSSIVEKNVTNRQALLFSNFMLSLMGGLVAINGPIWMGLCGFTWVCYSFMMMKRGGLLNED